MKRNDFLRAMGIGAVVTPNLFNYTPIDPKLPLDKALVQKFVGTSHRDMNESLAILEQYPTILNAAHDWGNGDFETALGAASHVGYKELVLALIEKGAQANIFTACLFGRMEIVKPFIDAYPKILHARGPHGFTLLHHAIRGGEEALEVKKYLESLGAVETKVAIF